jgi:hypothetical protein
LLEPAIAQALAAGQVTTTVRLADPNQASILRSGARIDLYADSGAGILADGKTVASNGGAAIAKNAVVLAVLPAAGQLSQQLAESTGLGLIIATDPATAGRLATRLSAPFLATLVPPP